jgi:ABC-type xylose transport system substrate-binding protein
MSDYTIEPGANEGSQGIWRHAGQTHFPLAYTTDTDPEVFRAAVAVLAPNDEVRELVAGAVFAAEGTDGEYYYTLADAVLAALKQHALGGGQ